jgi:transposase
MLILFIYTRLHRTIIVLPSKISTLFNSYGSYNALDVSGFYHQRINHSALFAAGKNHIKGIENFWNQAKRVLKKYNGIPKESFPLFLE